MLMTQTAWLLKPFTIIRTRSPPHRLLLLPMPVRPDERDVMWH